MSALVEDKGVIAIPSPSTLLANVWSLDCAISKYVPAIGAATLILGKLLFCSLTKAAMKLAKIAIKIEIKPVISESQVGCSGLTKERMLLGKAYILALDIAK